MLESLKFDAAGLVTVVVQDRHTGEIRMVAHANVEAIRLTLESGYAHFWSRSQKKLWKKGEESGNMIGVTEVFADCDADCLLYLADPSGPSCHTGRESCFYRPLTLAGLAAADESGEEARPLGAPTLLTLTRTLAARKESSDSKKSYTKSLLEKGAPKIGAKLREEADELANALVDEPDENVASEAADVLYHAMVGLLWRGLSLRDVAATLAGRFGVGGHEEKAARS